MFKLGGTATPESGLFESLTRRHRIKVSLLLVGDIVRHENVVAASRMNNAVLFMQTFAQVTVERGLEVDGLFVPVLPLSTPARKVTTSKTAPSISNNMLSRKLCQYGNISIGENIDRN